MLLALALDEWRQGAADRRRVARVQETIHDELVRNREIVRRGLPYHETILNSTRKFAQQSLAARESGPISGGIPALHKELGVAPNRGLGLAWNLERTGWELALNSGALEHMDFELTVALSQAYAHQAAMEDIRRYFSEQAFRLYRAALGEGNFDIEIQGFSAFLSDIVLRERELLAAYDRALAMTGRER